MIRALFFGSPAFAVPCLDALREVADVACVFSQPDRPAGRGLAPAQPAVKVRALELGLRVEQPEKIRTEAMLDLVRSFEADVALVVAYGRILPRPLLEAPRVGCLNVHASLLPAYRGAAPIQWAVAMGETETGVTLMQMDEGLDTGPIHAVRRIVIGPDETADELSPRLSALGAALVRDALADVVEGRSVARAQPSEGVSHARLLEKRDGLLPLERPARAVHAHARGMTSWPGAQLTLGDDVLKVFRTQVAEDAGTYGPPGTLIAVDADVVRIACGEGVLALGEVQASGKRRMKAAEYARGARLAPGHRFGGTT